MARWTVRLLAAPLVIAALSIALMRPTAVEAQTAPATTQSYGVIARTALAALNQQRGECFLWVRAVVQSAIGRTVGYDYHAGYLQAGGVEVPLASARDGDIIQITNPANTAGNAEYPGLHTSIVLDNLGAGKFRVIDSNANLDGIVRIREQYNPAELSARYPGLVLRVYRLPGAPGVTIPVVASPPPVGPTGTLPALGTTVTIAADGDCLRVRSAAGLAGSVLGCLPSGAQATIKQSGPTADGYRWVQVSAGLLTGWVAADYLSTVTASSPGTPAARGVVFNAPPVVAAPARGVFAAPPIFGGSGRQAAAVFMGGAVDQLIGAATDAKATGVWVQDSSGAFQLLIVGAPSFMVDAFRSRFGAPFAGPVAVTLIGTAS